MIRRTNTATRRHLLAIALTLAASAALAPGQQNQPKRWDREPEMKIEKDKIYVARIETSEGPIVAELYPKQAPHHVNSFVFLAKEGFYNGVIFHRVIPGFMIQGGDPTGTGRGGPGYELKAEFNEARHTRGVLSAARSSDPDSAGSQFFIMHGDSPHLDGKYSAFGKVTSGLEVVDKIVSAPRDGGDRPRNPAQIKSIKIETKDAGNAAEKK